MISFTTKKFSIPKLKGLSVKSVEEHIKLYEGYVKNANLILEKNEELKKDPEKNLYLISELSRRFSFEYNGMRNHELYFYSLEGGAKQFPKDGPLAKKVSETWGSFESWLADFKRLGMTRGIGWAMLYYDPRDSRLLNAWIDEQHLGQMNGCIPILGLDMWEHSYVADYQPSGKKNYIDDFFTNLNWQRIEENFKKNK